LKFSTYIYIYSYITYFAKLPSPVSIKGLLHAKFPERDDDILEELDLLIPPRAGQSRKEDFF